MTIDWMTGSISSLGLDQHASSPVTQTFVTQKSTPVMRPWFICWFRRCIYIVWLFTWFPIFFLFSSCIFLYLSSLLPYLFLWE